MNLFSSQTEESFSFLVSEYGFSEPTAADGSWKTTFLYVNNDNDMGIEIELNYKKMDAFVFIVKLEDGQLPETYEDQPVRKQLEDLIDVVPTKSNGDNTTIEQFGKGITNKSTLLRQNLDVVLTRLEKVFAEQN